MKKILLSLAFAGIGLSVNSYAQVIMSQDFEGVTTPALPTGWAATHTGAGNGFVTHSGTAAWAIGTLPAHTKYMFVDEYNAMGNTPAYCTSGTFSLAGVVAPYLSYDYFYYKAVLSATPHTGETAWMEISNNGGTSWILLDSISATNDNAWHTKYVNLGTVTGLTATANCKLRFCYTDNSAHLIGYAVDNITVFNAQANDISITGVTPVTGDALNDYKTVGANFTLGGTMFNRSPNTITSFNATYKVGTLAPVTCTLSGLSVAPFTSYNFSCTTPYTVTAVSTLPVSMWVTETGDPVLTNDTMGTNISGVSFLPGKKLAIEEATGTWCGYCVRGIVYMDSLATLHGSNASLVAVHNSDPMTVTAYDTWMGTQIGGYPSVVIDRTFVDDPSNLLAIYNQYSQAFGFADVTMTHTLAGTTLTVPVTVKPALDLNGDYRLVLVVTEEVVHGTGSTWAQHNYYSYMDNNQALTGQGVNYQDSIDVIPATSMYYNHVARSISPSVTGTAGVLPATMTNGTVYNATLTTTLTSSWVSNHLNYIVMLLDNSTGHVLNTQNFLATVGVSNISAGVEGLRVFPNPASDEATVIFDINKNSNVGINVYDAVGRVVYSVPAHEMNSGTQHVTIPVTTLASGVYNVIISTENGHVAEHLSVVK